MRTAVRKAETTTDAKDKNASGLLPDAIKKMDTAAHKGLIP